MQQRLFIFLVVGLCYSMMALAESQESEYKGITDPFGDPANYEFAEDEKEDKDFFHLGRYLMWGFDFGAGIFTSGLGRSAGAGFLSGVRLIYFFDKHIGLEAAAHYAMHVDLMQPNPSLNADIDTQLIPLTASFRYYFDTKDSPRALAIANPYLVLGAGAYLRNQKVVGGNLTFDTGEGFSSNFGLNLGTGMEFSIYRRHIYLGVDFRYHLIFFEDEVSGIQDSTGALVIAPEDRSGDYITTCLTLTYNF